LAEEGPSENQRPATLTDAQGQPVSLAAYRGKVILLDFWATWCGGFKLEISCYIAFYHTYRIERHDFTVDRGLVRQSRQSAAVTYLKRCERSVSRRE
jgi:AhpC/TSA family